MSPEEARGNPPDALSDVYSLGIVLYAMLTGEVPFRADTPLAVLHMQADSAPPSPRRLVPSLSPAIEAVVLRALSKEPASRYASAGKLAKAMTSALAGNMPAVAARVPARAGEPVKPVAGAVPPSRRLVWPWLLLAVVAVTLIFAGVFAAWPRSRDDEMHPTPEVAPPPTGQGLVVTATRPRPTPPAAVPAPSKVYIEYVLGASNTMMQPLQGEQTKLDVARSGLAQHWKEMRSQPNAGLRAYGHRLSAADVASCLDTELMVPVAEGHLDQMTGLLMRISARGMAPLNQALIEASGDFTFAPGRSNALILIADGGDSCDANPCQTVKTHHEVGTGYPIYVVGLAPDEEGRQQLMCIARSTQGRYRDAASDAEVLLALDEFVRHIAASEPATTTGPLPMPTRISNLEPSATVVPTGVTPSPVPLPTSTLVTMASPVPPAPTRTPSATESPRPSDTPTRAAPATEIPQPTSTSTSAPPPAVTGRIAFSAGGRLHIVSATDGRDTIAPIPDMRQPDCRRDGQQLIAMGFQGEKTSLWTINAGSGAFLRQQSGFTDDLNPFWAPAGNQFAYASYHHGLGQFQLLYVQALDDRSSKPEVPVLYGSTQIHGAFPVWMEDDWLVFKGCDYWPNDRGEMGGGRCGLYRVPSWGGPPAAVNLATPEIRATDERGGQLLIMTRESGDWEVYLMPAHGGEARNLSQGPGSQDGLGTFSPDGKMVAFASNRDGVWAVWAVRTDGTGRRRLFDLPAPLTGEWTEEQICWVP
jgi:hypothetical protein